LLAGRAAEQYIFNEITTGSKDDLNKATDIAREMVCSYGMSSLGTLALDELYIRYNYDSIRVEIKEITDISYKQALTIIGDHSQILHDIANTLLENETIEKDELDLIFEKHETPLDYAT
jgi:cell division protease FtsH